MGVAIADKRTQQMKPLGWHHAALCALMLALFMYSGSLLNGQVYSFVAGYFGWSREIATLCGALTFLAIGTAARMAPSLLDVRSITALAILFMLIQPPLFAIAASTQDPFLTSVALSMRSIARNWAFACFILCLTRLAEKRMVACAVVVGLFSGRALGSLGLMHVPTALNLDSAGFMYLIIGLTVIPLLYCAITALPIFETLRSCETPAVLELTNPNSFLGASHGLYQCMLLFATAGGFALTFNEIDHAPVALNVAAIILVAIGLLALFSLKAKQEDSLFSFCVMLVMAGFLLVPFELESAQTASNTLINLGEDCLEVLLYLVVFSIACRNLFAALPVFCFARFAAQIGTTVGAIAGHASDTVLFGPVYTAEALSALFIFAFFGFLWMRFRNFSFANIISGIECVETEHAAKMDASKEIRQSRMSVSKEERGADLNAGASSETDGGSSLNDSLDSKAPSSSTEPRTPFGDDPIKSIDECCEQVGEQHGLTPREREIFAMLAKGRNGRFIMEHYVISRNTVKSHIKHIYSKLDVHSQQELIDMVESELE